MKKEMKKEVYCDSDSRVIFQAALEYLEAQEKFKPDYELLLKDWNRASHMQIRQMDKSESVQLKEEMFKTQEEVIAFFRNNLLKNVIEQYKLSEEDIKNCIDFCATEMHQNGFSLLPVENSLKFFLLHKYNFVIYNVSIKEDKLINKLMITVTDTGFSILHREQFNQIGIAMGDTFKGKGQILAEVTYDVDFTTRDADGKITPTITRGKSSIKVEGENFQSCLKPVAMSIREIKEKEFEEFIKGLSDDEKGKVIKLKELCENYLAHLEASLEKKFDQTCEMKVLKIKSLLDILHSQPDSTIFEEKKEDEIDSFQQGKLEEFKQSFHAMKNFLALRRDRFSIFKAKGEKFADQVEELLSSMAPDDSLKISMSK